MGTILISGGTIVNEGRRFPGYVLVCDGVIVEVGEGDYFGTTTPSASRPPHLPPSDARHFQLACSRSLHSRSERLRPLQRRGTPHSQIIDATGKIVMPGVIDAHVHFREPGLTQKGDMASESAAAVAGGVTSVLEMPNTVPPATTLDALERKFDLAAGEDRGGVGRMHTNYSFFLGATNDNLAEVKKFASRGGVLVKLFIGSSTGNMLVDDDRAISALFAEFGGVIAAHCEDEKIIRANTDFYRRESGDRATAAIHPLVRSAEACYVSTARAVELAAKYGTNFHVCHVSTGRELALFDAGSLRSARNDELQKRITSEACVPHLWFSDEDYAALGNRIKCNPAIKTASDRAALREALSTGRIDLIATDHAPHTAAEKLRGYWDAPSGIPSVQHSLPVMFTLAAGGIMTLETLVEKMCHAPAVRFGIAERGFLRPGYKADIAIVAPEYITTPALRATPPKEGNRPCLDGWTVASENILSKCGWSPWEGEGSRLAAKVTTTIINGRIAWDGERIADTAFGERLEFRN